jgi:MFS family permease
MDTPRKTNDDRPRVLASLALCVLLSSLGTSSANVALPTLARAFDASFQQVQWVVIAYLLAMTALIVVVGRLGDLLGRRRLLIAGLVVFTFASVLCALAPTLSLLVAARAAQGFGAAAMMALAMALVGDAIPKAKTGSAMGLLGTMSAIGTALGPSLAGALISAFGWRTIFFVNLPLGLAAFALARRSLPDVQGEGRAATPWIRVAILRERAISTAFALSALVTAVVMATLVVGPFYLSGALGLGAAQVGAVMSVGPMVAALAGVPSGRLVDRLGPQAMTLGGLAAMALGCAALAAIPAAFGVWGYVAPLALITAAYALFQAANNTAVMMRIAQSERGVVSGLLNLSRNLGLIAGASAMATVFALATGASDVTAARPDQIATGMRITFALAAILLAASLALGLQGWRRWAPRRQS